MNLKANIVLIIFLLFFPGLVMAEHNASISRVEVNGASIKPDGSETAVVSPGETFWIGIKVKNTGSSSFTGFGQGVLWVEGYDEVEDYDDGNFDESTEYQNGSLKHKLSDGDTPTLVSRYYSIDATKGFWGVNESQELMVKVTAPSSGRIHFMARATFSSDPGWSLVTNDPSNYNDAGGVRDDQEHYAYRYRIDVESEPDLIVSEGPDLDRYQVTRGYDLELSTTVKNQGFGSSAKSYLGYFFSTSNDGYANACDDDYVSPLGSNDTSSESQICTIPSSLPASKTGTDYYAIARADYGDESSHRNLIAESEEGNNSASTSFTVFPPPVVSEWDDVDGSIFLGPGDSTTFNVTAQNIGGKAAEGGVTVSVSHGLEIIEVDGVSINPLQYQDTRNNEVRIFNFAKGDDAKQINTASGTSITPLNQLVETYAEYLYDTQKTFKFKVRAKSGTSGTQWIKHRVAMASAGYGSWDYRAPVSGEVDQQGWNSEKIQVVGALHAVRGIVTSTQWPSLGVQGVMVEADSGQKVVTGLNGTYELADVPAGDRTLTISHSDFTSSDSTRTLMVVADTENVDFQVAGRGQPQINISGVKSTVTPGETVEVVVTLKNIGDGVSGVTSYLDLSFDGSQVSVGEVSHGGFTVVEEYSPPDGPLYGVDEAGNPIKLSEAIEYLVSGYLVGGMAAGESVSFKVPLKVRSTATGSIKLKYRGTIGDKHIPGYSSEGETDQQGFFAETYEMQIAENHLVRGQVTSTKWPYHGIQGVTVEADSGQKGVTDLNGIYELAGVPAGDRTLTISHADFTSSNPAQTFTVGGDTDNINFQVACKGQPQVDISGVKPTVTPGETVEVVVTLKNIGAGVSGVTSYLDLSFDGSQVDVGEVSHGGFTVVEEYSPLDGPLYGVDEAGNPIKLSEAIEYLVSGYLVGGMASGEGVSFKVPLKVISTATGSIKLKYRGTIGGKHIPGYSSEGETDQQGFFAETYEMQIVENHLVRGQVTSTQWPYHGIQGVTVEADSGQKGVTDLDGIYELAGVPAGDRTLTISHADFTSSNPAQTLTVGGDTDNINFQVAGKGQPQIDISGVKSTVVPGETLGLTVSLENIGSDVSGVTAYLDFSFDNSQVEVGDISGEGFTAIEEYSPPRGPLYGVDEAGNPVEFPGAVEYLVSGYVVEGMASGERVSFTVPIKVKSTATGSIQLKCRGTIGDRRTPGYALEGATDQQGFFVDNFEIRIASPKAARQIPILAYHKVDDVAPTVYWVRTEDFRKQLAALKAYGYTSVTLEEVYQYVYGDGMLPEKPVVITFDDGYQNFYTKAYPALKEFGFTAINFLPVDYIRDSERKLNDWDSSDEERIYPAPHLLWSEVETMAAGGMIFESHTKTHPNLIDLNGYDSSAAEAEIFESKSILESRLGKAVNFFSYPYTAGSDDDNIHKYVRNAGYHGAVNVDRKIFDTSLGDFVRINRIAIDRDDYTDYLGPNLPFFMTKVDNDFPVPQIVIDSIEFLDPSTGAPIDFSFLGQKVKVRVVATNSGDSSDVVVSLNIDDPNHEALLFDSHTSNPVMDKSDHFGAGETKTFEWDWVVGGGSPVGPIQAIVGFHDANYVLGYAYSSWEQCEIALVGPEGIGERNPTDEYYGSVNMVTGDHVYSQTLFTLPGKGLPLDFTITNHTLAPKKIVSPLGLGWTHNLNLRLYRVESAGEYRIVDGEGYILRYADTPKSPFTNKTPGNFNLLYFDGTGYRLRRPDKTEFIFDSGGNLVRVQDKSGNALTLSYSNGLLAVVTDTVGREVRLKYGEPGNLKRIELPDGSAFSFDSGYLFNSVAHIGEDGSEAQPVRFEYTDIFNPRLREVELPSGDNAFGLTFLPSGRVDTLSNALGHVWHFSYKAGSHEVEDPDGVVTSIVPPAADEQSPTLVTLFGGAYDFTSNLLLKSYASPKNDTTQIAYLKPENTQLFGEVTERPLITSAQSPDNRQVLIEYDHSENPETIQLKGAGGGDVLTQKMDYDPQNRVSDIWEMIGGAPSGNPIHIDYRADGLVSSIVNQNSQAYTLTYDSGGNLSGVQTPEGRTVTAHFDQMGNVEFQIDGEGNKTQYRYDSFGRLHKVIDPLLKETVYTYTDNGQLETVAVPGVGATRYGYDEAGRVETVERPVLGTVRYQYTKAGRQKRVIYPANDSLGWVYYDYDDKGRVKSVTDATGQQVSYTYDANDNVETVTDGASRTRNSYDVLDRVETVSVAPVTAGVVGSFETVGSYRYHDNGQVATFADGEGTERHYGYDQRGNLESISIRSAAEASAGLPPKLLAEYAYTALDQLESIQYGDGSKILELEYDNDGNVIRSFNGLVQKKSFAYDGNGQVDAVTDRNGTYFDFKRDALGRVESLAWTGGGRAGSRGFAYHPVSGDLETVTEEAGVTRMAYDSIHRLTSRTDVFGNTVEYAYNDLGLIRRITYPGDKKVYYAYDNQGRMAGVTDWNGKKTTYEYDGPSRLKAILYPSGAEAHYRYDGQGRVSQVQHVWRDSGDGSFRTIETRSYDYDKAGNIETIDSQGGLDHLYPADVTDRMTYDLKTDRILTKNGHSFGFDANGNFRSQETFEGPVSYVYDAEDRLSTVSGGGRASSYRYAAGQRVESTVDGQITRFVWDPIIGYGNVLVEMDRGNQPSHYYIHGLGLLARIDAATGKYEYFHHDQIGNTVALSDSQGWMTDRYAYDPFGSSMRHEGNSDNPYLFAGQFGVRDDGNGLLFMRDRYYHRDTGRFLTVDPESPGLRNVPSLNPYMYGNNNPLIYSDPDGRFAQLAWGAAIGFGVDLAAQAIATRGFSNGGYNWKQGLSMTAVGAATGGISAFSGSVTANVGTAVGREVVTGLIETSGDVALARLEGESLSAGTTAVMFLANTVIPGGGGAGSRAVRKVRLTKWEKRVLDEGEDNFRISSDATDTFKKFIDAADTADENVMHIAQHFNPRSKVELRDDLFDYFGKRRMNGKLKPKTKHSVSNVPHHEVLDAFRKAGSPFGGKFDYKGRKFKAGYRKTPTHFGSSEYLPATIYEVR